MHPKVRSSLYALFLLAFLVIAPAVVLYTAGFRLNFETGRVLQTGLLSIESGPRGADIWIDGKNTGSKTPALVENILPGDHHIRLTKDGYHAWEKTLLFASRETTFATNVVLFSEDEPRLVREAPLTMIAVDPTRRRAASIISEGSWSEIWVMMSGSETQTLLARYPNQTPVQGLRWSADGSFLEVRTGVAARPQISLVNATTGKALNPREEIVDLQEGWWDARDGSRYIVQTPRGFFLLPASGGMAFPVAEVATSARSDGGRFLLTQPVGDRTILSQFDPNTDVSAIVAYLPTGSYQFHPSPNGLALLEDEARNRLILVDERGGNEPILLETTAERWQWHPSWQRKLLLSDGFDLHVFDAEARTDETITRLSGPITGLSWHKSGKAALVSQNDKIFAIEFDGRDRRNVVELASGSRITHVWTDDQSKTMYFFGEMDGVSGLYSRVLQK
jgi:hypothetical protein